MSRHYWSEPDADGVKQCRFCPVRMAESENYVWQRKKGAHWRKMSSEPLPPCKSEAGMDLGDGIHTDAVGGSPFPPGVKVERLSPRAATTPEPPPVRTDSPAVWPLVITAVPEVLAETSVHVRERLAADMAARDSEGRRKYGTPLQVENGRNAAVDAYQEALDLTVYARQQWERHHTRAWWTIYEDAVRLAARVCAELVGAGR